MADNPTQDVLPGHETQKLDEMNCPSCGRFVGAKIHCPYCGAKVAKRMSLVAVRYAAVLLATIGLVLLWAMAKFHDTPVVKIGDISPTMNFAQIRVDGTADSDVRTFRNGGMGFNISDGTGTLMVFVSQKQGEELRRLGKLPHAGDAVQLNGTVSLSDKSNSLRLQSASSVSVTPAPARPIALGDLGDDLAGSAFLIQGQVTGFTAPPTGTKRPYSLYLKDDSGTATVTFWQDEYDAIADKDALVEGTWLRMRISVASYKGKMQLKLSDGASVEALAAEDRAPAAAAPAAAAPKPEKKAPKAEAKEAPAKKEAAPAPVRDFSRKKSLPAGDLLTPVRELHSGIAGQTVRIRARVQEVKEPAEGSKKPTELVVYDEAGDRLVVKYWDAAARVMKEKPVPGSLYDFEGTVDIYRSRPALKVESGYKIRLVSDVPPSTPAVDVSQAVPVATLAAGGDAVVVVGTLSDESPLRGGVKFRLTDEAGDAIDAVFWEGSIPRDLRAQLENGKKVAVRGVPKERNGVLDLVAKGGYSVMTLE